MQATFNLIDEPWIPAESVHATRGAVLQRASLRDALTDPSKFGSIQHHSPLAIAALYRFLGVILQRALESHLRAAVDHSRLCAEWFVAGWPANDVARYLDTWHHTFDLFSETAPFMQIRDLHDDKWVDPWTRLTADMGSGNTSFLYNAKNRPAQDQHAAPLIPADAAIYLIEHQQFALGGLIKRGGVTSVQAAPVASSAVFLPMGRTLQESLVLQLFDNRKHAKHDLPVWEWTTWPMTQSDVLKQEPLVADGPLSAITWPSRAIRFLPSAEGNGVVIHEMMYAPGSPMSNVADRGLEDPMVGMRVTEDNKALPLRMSMSKALWRNAHAFLPLHVGSSPSSLRQPAVIEHAFAVWQVLVETGIEHERGLRAIGQVNDKSKVELVVDETYQIGPAALNSRLAGYLISVPLEVSGKIGQALNAAANAAAKHLLRFDAQGADPDAARKMTEVLAAASTFWHSMDALFPRYLSQAESDQDLETLLRQMHAAAYAAWDTACNRVGRSARNIRAIAAGTTMLRRRLREIKELFNEEQV